MRIFSIYIELHLFYVKFIAQGIKNPRLYLRMFQAGESCISGQAIPSIFAARSNSATLASGRSIPCAYAFASEMNSISPG